MSMLALFPANLTLRASNFSETSNLQIWEGLMEFLQEELDAMSDDEAAELDVEMMMTFKLIQRFADRDGLWPAWLQMVWPQSDISSENHTLAGMDEARVGTLPPAILARLQEYFTLASMYAETRKVKSKYKLVDYQDPTITPFLCMLQSFPTVAHVYLIVREHLIEYPNPTTGAFEKILLPLPRMPIRHDINEAANVQIREVVESQSDATRREDRREAEWQQFLREIHERRGVAQAHQY